jgi:hypothetical protein
LATTHWRVLPSSYQMNRKPLTLLYQRSPTVCPTGGTGPIVIFGVVVAISPPDEKGQSYRPL